MNPMQLTMIAAFAQAQTQAQLWHYDHSSEGYYYEDRYDWQLVIGDDGFLFRVTEESEAVPVKSVSHLHALIDGAIG